MIFPVRTPHLHVHTVAWYKPKINRPGFTENRSTSGFGTFRTWRDVRLESVNRLTADMINAEKFQKWFELPKADLAALAAKVKGK